MDTNNTVEPIQNETLPNPNFYWGSDTFRLTNGDTYMGSYCCHKSGIIWREGKGIYKTDDDHTYIGTWENDQLLDSHESKIIYPNGEEYLGHIQKGKYSGAGTVIFNNKLILQANFVENTPVGEVTLIDYANHLWQGIVADNNAEILCVNHFYESLDPKRGLGELMKQHSVSKGKHSTSRSFQNISQKYLKEDIFAPSVKTKNDFTMEPSSLADKSITSASSKQTSELSLSLLKTFLSKDYRKNNFPVKIFTPTCDQQNDEIKENEETVCE